MQPLLLLALAARRNSNSTPPAALPRTVSRIGNTPMGGQLPVAADGTQRLELRPFLLHQPGLLLPGAPIFAPTAAAAAQANLGAHCQQQQQQQQAYGCTAAALSGTLAAAAGPGGLVKVWDVLTGQTLMAMKRPVGGTICEAAAVEVLELQQQQQQECPRAGRAKSGTVVMLGTSNGVLTFTLL